MSTEELSSTIQSIITPGKGILAADESVPTITKRFQALGIESTEETRRAYRSLLLTTKGAEEYLSGVILFEETLNQKADDGTPLAELLARRGIMPGIKVDKGTTPLPGAEGDLVTQGLDGLGERLKGYKAKGARSTRSPIAIRRRSASPPTRKFSRATRLSASRKGWCRSSSRKS